MNSATLPADLREHLFRSQKIVEYSVHSPSSDDEGAGLEFVKLVAKQGVPGLQSRKLLAVRLDLLGCLAQGAIATL